MSDSIRILIVDDRPEGVLFLSEFLHSRGHQVEVSSNGQEALEAVLRKNRTPDAYDLVFAALAMVQLDGLALLRNLSRRQITISSVLYASPGSVTPEISQQAKQFGCVSILEKPLALQRVEYLLDELRRRSGPGASSQSKNGDKPFFGTSRIIRVDEERSPPKPTAPSVALERVRRPSSVELLALPPMPAASLGPPPPPTFFTPPPIVASSVAPPQTAPGVQPPVALPSTAYFRSRPTSDSQTASEPRRATGSYRRSLDPPVRTPTSTYTRRHSGLFTLPPESPAPPAPDASINPTTSRLRRTISGTHQPVAASSAEPAAPSSRSVACAHCQKVFLVMAKPQSYTVICLHCGQMNRIDPF